MDVHHIFDVFRVPEGKFNRLNLASLTIATNYFRPTRILCCIDWLSEVVSLFLYYCMSFDLFESNNKKCNFLELNVLAAVQTRAMVAKESKPPKPLKVKSVPGLDIGPEELKQQQQQRPFNGL